MFDLLHETDLWSHLIKPQPAILHQPSTVSHDNGTEQSVPLDVISATVPS